MLQLLPSPFSHTCTYHTNAAYRAHCAPWLKGSAWWRDAKFAPNLLFISTWFSSLCQEPLITGSLDVVSGSDFLKHTLMLPHVAPILFFFSLVLSVKWQENIPPGTFYPEFVKSTTHFFSLLLHCPSPTPGLRVWKTQWGTDVTNTFLGGQPLIIKIMVAGFPLCVSASGTPSEHIHHVAVRIANTVP